MNSQGHELSRRKFLGGSAAASLAGLAGTACQVEAEAAAGASVAQIRGASRSIPNSEASLRDNIYTRLLGVRPHLGAHEHLTTLGGSRMPAEVLDAMGEANDYFVDMHELTTAAGSRVAQLMGAEDALVTCGAFSAMILGAAACLTGTDADKIRALPHPTWPRSECLIQTEHRFSYDRAYRAAGMSIVEASTRRDVAAKINENTAMIAVLVAVEKQREFGPPLPQKRAMDHGEHVIMPEEFIEIGKRAGVPVLVDMASDLPPAENLSRFISAGADLVTISGGKGIRGPQSTGILAGRADLIEAARLHASPNGNLGRGMKVGKEEIIGLVVALERYVALDHQALVEGWNAKARWIADELQDVEGLNAEYALNTVGYADVELTWDEVAFPVTAGEVRQRLRDGEPRLAYDGVTVRTRCLRDGEEVLVAQRLRRLFEEELRRA
jgi:L-seryl-tRNA(Ser) seleniumtransferase